MSGGGGNDTFNLVSTAPIGALFGGAGAGDTIVGDDVVNAWAVTAADEGTVGAQGLL